MGSGIADLLIKILADAKGLIDEAGKSEKALDSLASLATKAFTGLIAIVEGLSLKKLVTEIVELTKEAGRHGEEIQHLSEIYGISQRAIQEWSVAFGRANLGPQDLATGMRTLSHVLQEAKDQTSDSARTLRELGLDAKQLAGDPEQAIRLIADRVSLMRDGFDKARIMTDLLGRSGAALIPLFNGGAKAIDEATKAAHDMHAVLGTQQLKDLQQVDDAFDDLKTATSGLSHEIGAAFAPAVQWFVEKLTVVISGTTRLWQLSEDAATKLTIRIFALAQVAYEVATSLTDLFSAQGREGLKQRIALINQEAAAMLALADAGAKRQSQEEADDRSGAIEQKTQKEIDALRKASEAYRQLAEIKADAAKKLADISLRGADISIVGQLEREEISLRQSFEARRQLARDQTAAELTQLAAKQQALQQAHNEEKQLLLGDDLKAAVNQFNNDMTKLNLERQAAKKQENLELFKLDVEEANSRHKTDEELKDSARSFRVWEETFRREQAQRRLDNEAATAQAELDLARQSVNTREGLKDLELAVIDRQEAAQLQKDGLNAVERENIQKESAAKRLAVEQTYAAMAIQTDLQVLQADLAMAEARGASAENLSQLRLAIIRKEGELALQTQVKTEADRQAILKGMAAKEETERRAQQDRELQGEIVLAHARVDAAQAGFATAATVAGLRRQALELELQKELDAQNLTESQRLAIITRYGAMIDQERRREVGGFLEFYRQGLQEYLNSTTNVFNIATDFARTTVQTVASGIQAILQSAVQSTQTLSQLLQSGLNVVTGLVTKVIADLITAWIFSTLIQNTEIGKQLAAWAAGESGKTALTVTNEGVRLGLMAATNKVMLAGVIATLGGIAAVGHAAIATAVIVGELVAAMLAAIGAALAATVVGAPFAPPFIAAAATVSAATAASGAIALASFETALGTSIVTATTALATPFAEGGIVTGPTLALIGEAGDEAVIPLDRADDFMSGNSRPMVVNLYVDDSLIARAIAPALMDHLHLQGVRA